MNTLINKFGAPILLGAFIGWFLGDGLVLLFMKYLPMNLVMVMYL